MVVRHYCSRCITACDRCEQLILQTSYDSEMCHLEHERLEEKEGECGEGSYCEYCYYHLSDLFETLDNHEMPPNYNWSPYG